MRRIKIVHHDDLAPQRVVALQLQGLFRGDRCLGRAPRQYATIPQATSACPPCALAAAWPAKARRPECLPVRLPARPPRRAHHPEYRCRRQSVARIPGFISSAAILCPSDPMAETAAVPSGRPASPGQSAHRCIREIPDHAVESLLDIVQRVLHRPIQQGQVFSGPAVIFEALQRRRAQIERLNTSPSRPEIFSRRFKVPPSTAMDISALSANAAEKRVNCW